MNIGFVAEPYEERNASGMGYVVIELLKNLPPRPRRLTHYLFFKTGKPGVDRAAV